MAECNHEREGLVWVDDLGYLCPECHEVFAHYDVEPRVKQLLTKLDDLRRQLYLMNRHADCDVVDEAMLYIRSHS